MVALARYTMVVSLYNPDQIADAGTWRLMSYRSATMDDALALDEKDIPGFPINNVPASAL